MNQLLGIASLQLCLVRCYVSGVRTVLRLPRLLRQPTELAEALGRLPPGGALDIDVPAAEVDAYNAMMAATKARCLAVGGSLWLRDFEKQLMPAMLCLRIAATLCALYYGPAGRALVLCLLASQLLVAPLSLVPAVSTLVALAQPMFVGHYLVYPLLAWVLEAALPPAAVDLTSVVIGAEFIASFVVIDQLLCVLCLFWCPDGKPAKIRTKQLVRSVTYGFVNCKTYQLMIFALLAGLRINVAVLAIDWALGLSARVCEAVRKTGYNWSSLFYHQHRLAHLPSVYQHAHKFHHSLQGTTAFDAHLYGNGMPEELATFALEFGAAALAGIAPATLNFNTLYHSWTDKVGHTLKEVNTNGCNAHPLHHIHHTKNYGIFDMSIDLLFGTCVEPTSFPGPHGCTITRTAIPAPANSGSKGQAMVRLQYRRER